jgi:Icc-related predicted phosphoesterase
MNCLVVGDTHFGRRGRGRHGEQSATDSDDGVRPVPAAWGDYDVLLLVGDVLDRVAPSPDPAALFLDQIDDLGVPTFAVPGNHDYPVFDDLLADCENVVNLDGLQETVGEWTFYGLASDRFNDGPEVRYPHWPALSGESPETVERRVRSAVEDDTENSPEGTDLDSSNSGSLSLYTDRVNKLASLTPNDGGVKTFALTHLPPFGSGLDTLDANHPRYGGQPWGSVAVRTHLERASPDCLACGHIHESAGVERLGDTVCVNPGFRSVYAVQLTAGGVESVSRP